MMNDPIISAYWKVLDKVKKTLPAQEHVLKCAYHFGCAVKEIRKGVDVLTQKGINKAKKAQQTKKIVID